MTSPIERPWRRGGSWALLIGSCVLAVAAVGTLALAAEDTRLLRLGIVAALWAALLGTFATARMRRDINSSTDRFEELRTVYQLELEREIAARRDHELTVEREIRVQLEERQQADIVALRTELQSLRGTLQSLLGGDVLVERVALRESTRLRPLSDRPRTVSATDTVSRASRSVTVSEWPLSEPSVSEVRTESLLPGRPNSVPPEQPVEPHPTHDTGFGDRSWSPAVNWTPSSAVASTVPSTGTSRGRRHLPEPDPPASNGRGSESNWTSSSVESSRWQAVSPYDTAAAPEPRTNDVESQSPAQSVGAHRGGRSVQELLAAYGENPTPRHRRRRQDGT
jgi:hypothetical protein